MRAVVALGALFAVALAGCGGQSVRNASRGPLYTVTATVMQKPGEPPHACAFEPLPLPPIGCGGPDIDGLDVSSISGATRYSNGVVGTGMLRLVGEWSDRSLHLTEPPQHAAVSDATEVPGCKPEGQQLDGTVPPVVKRIASDDALLKSKGIALIEFGGCNASAFMTVAVADTATVTFLTNRYGDVQINGWLQPIQ